MAIKSRPPCFRRGCWVAMTGKLYVQFHTGEVRQYEGWEYNDHVELANHVHHGGIYNLLKRHGKPKSVRSNWPTGVPLETWLGGAH